MADETPPVATPAAPVTPAPTGVAIPATTPPATPTPEAAPLIAGKFKTVEDLATAYKALETKLGQRPAPVEPKPEPSSTVIPTIITTPTTETGVQTAAPGQTVAAAEGFIATVLAKANLKGEELLRKFATDGQLDPDDYQKLNQQNVTRKDVDTLLRAQAAEIKATEEYRQASQAEAVQIAGGTQQLSTLMQWAGSPDSGLTSVQLEHLNRGLAKRETLGGALRELANLYGAKHGTAAEQPLFTASAMASSGAVAHFETGHERRAARDAAELKYGEGNWHKDPVFVARLQRTKMVNPSALK